jgi:Rieske Fe-S protein
MSSASALTVAATVIIACRGGDKPPPDGPATTTRRVRRRVRLGPVDQFQPGEVVRRDDARCWVVRFNAEQARREDVPEGSLLALHQRCPHLGCTSVHMPEFVFMDPRTDETVRGWFRCPCHGGTFTLTGVRVFGPPPRNMDIMGLEIIDGELVVDTNDVTPGAQYGETPTVSPLVP